MQGVEITKTTYLKLQEEWRETAVLDEIHLSLLTDNTGVVNIITLICLNNIESYNAKIFWVQDKDVLPIISEIIYKYKITIDMDMPVYTFSFRGQFGWLYEAELKEIARWVNVLAQEGMLPQTIEKLQQRLKYTHEQPKGR